MVHEKFDITKQNLEPLRGIVKEVLFYKETTGYSVVALDIGEETVNVAGSLPLIYAGASICAYGVWYNHPKYGKQFTCAYYETKPVYNAQTAFSYLSSGVIRGVGIATAKKIVDKFGDETFDIIENDYDRLIDVNGITAKKARLIHDEYIRKNEYQEILTFFASLKIPPDIALKAYNVFGVMTIPLIKNNPYILWENIERIHFFYVDKLALQLGFNYNSPERVDAAIIYCLNFDIQRGNTCLSYNDLITAVVNLIKVNYKLVESGIERLAQNKKIVCKPIENINYLMLPIYYEAEEYIAKRVKTLAKKSYSDAVQSEAILKNTRLSALQKTAVKKSLENGITIITGGPGTGKTAIIKAIIKCAQAMDKKVILTAPTGRAAKRASELSGYEASTIHRLLDITGKNDSNPMFLRNETNPLECDVIIVDEMSMTDEILFKALLCALKENTRVVLIGDRNQLPPIGAGNVLRDLILSNRVECITLNKIYRQNNQSLIIENAHRILDGYDELIYNEKDSDFYIMNSSGSQDAHKKMIELLTKRLPEYLNIPSDKIQVITPLRKSVIGSVVLNKVIKDALNPVKNGEPSKTHGEYTYSIGDRVMQVKNDYDMEWETPGGEAGKGIFNGDMGVIIGMNMAEGKMTILFDEDKEVIYEFAKLENLELSYAITVHKSQGSEFDAVVLPFIFQSDNFMNRNILYTAVTRAKKFVCILGSKNVVRSMIKNRTIKKRLTYLGELFNK